MRNLKEQTLNETILDVNVFKRVKTVIQILNEMKRD